MRPRAPRAPHATALAVLVLAAFVVLAYAPSFSVPFAFDDAPNIVFNPAVQPDGVAELGQALDARGPRDRPVAMLTFALNYLHAGLDVRWYHAVNLAVHLANTMLLFALVRLLAGAPLSPPSLRDNAFAFAFAAALIWAVHPVNTQAVTYIVQRMASLAATFYLAGLLLFVLWRSGRLDLRWALPGLALAFVAGMGTKLIVVTLPLAILLVDVALYSGFRRVHVFALGAIALGGAGLVVLHAGDQFQYLFEPPPNRDFSGLERLMTQGRVIWHYLSLLAWPDAGRLQLDYDFGVSRGLLDPPTTLPAAVGILALSVAAVCLLRRWPWPAFGWLFFLLALSVESSVVLLELVFEHRLYLPSTLLIAAILTPVFAAPAAVSHRRWLTVAVFVIGGLLSLQTIERNRQWQDLGSFWAADLERGASLYRAALNGGIGFLRAGESARALELFEHIEASDVMTNTRQRGKIAQLKGEAYFRQGRPETALAEFRRALEFRPEWTRSAYFAAMSLLQLGRPEDALDVLTQMQAHHPQSVFTTSLEAEWLAVTGSRQQGIELLLHRLANASDLHAVNRSFLHLHLGNMYRDLGDHASAARHYRRALDESGDNWAAAASLAELEAGGAREQDGEVAR